MAMIVKNNMGAQRTLNTLNKNSKKLEKAFSKVASGMKIVGAGDGASEYAISEKMREQIRSLFQDDQNVQNGQSLFKIAAGGIDSIVEELRTLKELAIKSANDTNNDGDRLTIQKEFTQRMATINDIATETDYNTKKLLDGSLANSAVIAISEKVGDLGGTGETSSGSTNMVDSFTSNDAFYQPIICKKGTNPYYKYRGNPDSPYWVSGGYFPVTKSWQGSSGTSAYVDFSSVSVSGSVPNFLNGKGISIACGTCSQYVTIKFDKSIGAQDSSFNPSKQTVMGPTDIVTHPEFTIGVRDVSSMSQLARAIFVGVGSARNEPTGAGDTVTVDNGSHNISMYFDSNEGKYVITKDANPLQFFGGVYGETPVDEPEPEEVFFGYDSPLKIHHGPHANQSTSFYINDMHTKSLGTNVLFHNDISKLSDYERIIEESDRELYDSMSYSKKLQDQFVKTLKGFTPPRYADNIEDLPDERRIVDESDRARYQALSYDKDLQNTWVETLRSSNSKTLDDIDVITKKNANTAIRVIDNAISYALNESTRIGSYLQRLEYTGMNITTMNENVQGAESTIRDADMAKEMTEYTKFNVLTQASQSMLAQANQNASSVLSLLQ